jgi:hypothetical protein
MINNHLATHMNITSSNMAHQLIFGDLEKLGGLLAEDNQSS